MPLKKGSSSAAIRSNIKTEIHAGKPKPQPSPTPSRGNISKPREAGWQHAAYECDNCARPITLVSAQCVTNATEHLHACSDPACVTKLEQRLGTSDYDINVKPGDIG